MNARLAHMQINIAPANLEFYRDLSSAVGLKTLYETDGMLGVECSNGTSLWFIGASNGAANDYDGPGTNHIGLGAESQDEVDATVDWLKSKGVDRLFDTPQHRPEFSADENSTYYQVMFESPDKVLFEVVYTGPKS
jgi:catechol 2,3-dioxygenase-like lactoylglutathione lyase family enzyme